MTDKKIKHPLKTLTRYLLLGTATIALSAQAATAEDLKEALVSTYKTNPRIKAERKVLETVDERVAQAVSGWSTDIFIGYAKGRQRTRPGSSADWASSDREDRTLTLSQPIFNGGETVAGTESAKFLVLAGRESLRAITQQVFLDAIVAYMDVLRDQSVLELSRNNEEVLRKQLQASKDRFEVGEVTRTDVAQSEARLARAQSDTIAARGSLISSRASYERVIGNKAESLSAPSDFPALPPTLEDAIAVGLENSPNMLQADYSQRAADSDIDVAFAALLPDVSLEGRISRAEGQGFTGATDFDSDSILVNLSVPLYQSGSEYSRVREAKSRASQRKFNLFDVRDQTEELITQSWEDLQTSIATIKSSQANIEAAEVALDGVKQEQLYGSRTVLDVLDAEQELFVARVNLVRAERDRVVAIFNLLGSVGRLDVANLALDTNTYDPSEHYDDVKYQFIGF